MIWVVLGIIVLLVLLLIFAYNGMVKARNKVDESWSGIDVQLKRRHDLIPNLVETVKGYATHEKEVFENVSAARSAAISAQGPAAQAQAETALSGALGRLFAVAEAYPQLRAVESFKALQDELSDTENKIAAARRYYNTTVRRYNTALQSVPTNVIAGATGFTRREFYRIEDDADREPVAVKLGT